MSREGYHISDQKAKHFVTFTVVYWIDIFTQQAFRDIVIDTFRHYRQNQGLKVHAYVIMPNHIHAVLSATMPKYDLSTIIGNMKRYIANQILKDIETEHDSRGWWMLRLFKYAASQHKRNSKYQVFTHQNHPIELSDRDILEQKIDYIHDNPVQAGFVEEGHHWKYSSAANYTSQLSIMPIDLIDEFVSDGWGFRAGDSV